MTTTPGGIFVNHADHNLTEVHFGLIDRALQGWDGKFRMFSISLNNDLALPSALYGPLAGDPPVGEDEVTYEVRAERQGPSRLIDKPHRPWNNMVVIAGPGGLGKSVIYTAFGGPLGSEREWWDPSMTPAEALVAAKFWMVHALAK